MGRPDGKHLPLKLVALRQLSEMSCGLPVSGVVFSCQNSLCWGPPTVGHELGKNRKNAAGCEEGVRFSCRFPAFLFLQLLWGLVGIQ